MTIFSISRNHYLKNKLDGKKMFIRPKLISKKPQLTFPFRQKCFETSRHLTFYRLYPENFFCLFFQTGVIALIEYKTKHKLNNIYFLHLKTLVRSKECRCDKSFLHIFIREQLLSMFPSTFILRNCQLALTPSSACTLQSKDTLQSYFGI